MSESPEIRHSQEGEIRQTVSPVDAHIAFGMINRELLKPEAHTITGEQRHALLTAEVGQLDPLIQKANEISLKSRKKFQEGDARSFDEINKEFNEGLWAEVKFLTAEDVPQTQRTERLGTLTALGIDVNDAAKDQGGNLYKQIEDFRVKYVDRGGSNIGKFIEDVSSVCIKADGSVDLVQLQRRLEGLGDLPIAFGIQDSAGELVKRFAMTRGLLTTKGEERQQVVANASRQMSRPITDETERTMLRALHDEHEPDRPPVEAPNNDPLNTAEMKLALDHMAYSDVLPDNDAEKEKSIKFFTTDSERGRLYVRELQGILSEHGEAPILEKAQEKVRELQQALQSLGIEGTPYGKSETWYLWHAAKSRFLAKHQDMQAALPNADKYHPFDPLVQYKDGVAPTDKDKSIKAEEELVLTQLGWEVVDHLGRTNEDILAKLNTDISATDRTRLTALLAEERTGTGLSSYKLREIGEIIDRNRPKDNDRSEKAGFEPQELKDLMAQEAWQRLEPHYPSPDALLPKDLTAEQIQDIFEAVADPSIITFEQRGRNAFTFDTKDIPGLGTITKLGSGESKAVYELITTAGKKLVVSMRSATSEPGLHIPDDPRLVMRKNSDLRRTEWEYSDLHTYMILPTNKEHFVVQLQEHGGKDNTIDAMGTRDSVTARALRSKTRAKQQVIEYLQSKSDKFNY